MIIDSKNISLYLHEAGISLLRLLRADIVSLEKVLVIFFNFLVLGRCVTALLKWNLKLI
jgi:hypothetical protein